MHQHRTSPSLASPASSPWNNASTTSPPEPRPETRSRPASDMANSSERPVGPAEGGDGAQAAYQVQPAAGQSREGKTKLNQIIQVRRSSRPHTHAHMPQNYYVKAALIVAQSRMICPPSYNKGASTRRVNKWVGRLSVSKRATLMVLVQRRD